MLLEKPALKVFIFVIFLAGVFFHSFQLETLPRGLYVDESSIGLNAALIAQAGHDEHWVAWPVFFEAFGEYKNPLYIYLAAGIFKVVGVSVFSLRLTSVICFYIFFLFTFLLLKKIFKKNWSLLLYAALSITFLPWFFNLSRISFEVISQLSTIAMFLYFLYEAYENDHQNKNLLAKFAPYLAGFALGLSVYSYSTARLLSLLLFGGVLFVYRKRKFYIRHLKLTAVMLLTLIPLFSFTQQHPRALVTRFREVSYLYRQDGVYLEKINQFFTNYTQYVSFDYLFFKGDSIPRHHPGPRGEIFSVVGVLAFFGMLHLFRERKKSEFYKYIIFFVFISPMAAALTDGDSSLRSILLGFGIILLSCFGWNILESSLDRLPNKKEIRWRILPLVYILLILEIAMYLNNYFSVYPAKSVWEFQSYDVGESIELALKNSSSDVIMSSRGNAQYAHGEFYAMTLGFPHDAIPTREPVAKEGRCVIVSGFSEDVINEEKYELSEFSTPGNFTKVKCFGAKLAE